MSEEKDQKKAPVPRSSPTGVGSEATEGVHGADGDRAEAHNTALTGKPTGRSSKYGGGSRKEDDSGQRSP